MKTEQAKIHQVNLPIQGMPDRYLIMLFVGSDDELADALKGLEDYEAHKPPVIFTRRA